MMLGAVWDPGRGRKPRALRIDSVTPVDLEVAGLGRGDDSAQGTLDARPVGGYHHAGDGTAGDVHLSPATWYASPLGGVGLDSNEQDRDRASQILLAHAALSRDMRE